MRMVWKTGMNNEKNRQKRNRETERGEERNRGRVAEPKSNQGWKIATARAAKPSDRSPDLFRILSRCERRCQASRQAFSRGGNPAAGTTPRMTPSRQAAEPPSRQDPAQKPSRTFLALPARPAGELWISAMKAPRASPFCGSAALTRATRSSKSDPSLPIGLPLA